MDHLKIAQGDNIGHNKELANPKWGGGFEIEN